MKRSILICVCLFFVSQSVTATLYFSPSYLITTALALLSMTSRVNADVCKCYGFCTLVSKFQFVQADEKATASNFRDNTCHLPSVEEIQPICEYVEEGNERPEVKKNEYLKINYSFTEFRSSKKNKMECAGLNLVEISKHTDEAYALCDIENIFGASCREAQEKFYTSKSAEKKKGSAEKKKGSAKKKKGSAKKKRKMTKRRS